MGGGGWGLVVACGQHAYLFMRGWWYSVYEQGEAWGVGRRRGGGLRGSGGGGGGGG